MKKYLRLTLYAFLEGFGLHADTLSGQVDRGTSFGRGF